VGTGTLTLDVGDASTDIAIDAESNTLSGIAAAINDADAGVTAHVMDDGTGNAYLTLFSRETGSDNTITLTVADDDGVNDDASGLSSLYTDPAAQTLTQTQEARNAQLTVNGMPVERASNTVEDVVEGLTLTLNEADPGSPVSVDVAENAISAVTRIQNFVKAYNTVADTFESLQSYDPESEEAGLLLGDRTATMLQSRLRRFLSEQVDGVSSEVNGLSRIGIAVNQDGQLTVDEDVLTQALDEHRDDVLAFFTQDDEGNRGFAVQLYDALDAYVKTGGVIENKTDGIQASVDDIEDQIESMEVRFVQREENLRNQFQSLEVLLAEYQTTESMLTEQLASLDNLNNFISSK
jgi:flagellar hook-associated protein 2